MIWNNLSFRFIKMELENGRWRTYFNLDEETFIGLLNKLLPKNVYISVNKWLNYNEKKPERNILLNRCFFIDIDGQEFKDKESSKRYFIKINNYLKEEKICIEERICSNEKIGGYEIIVKPCCYSKTLRLIRNHPQRFRKIDSRVFDEKRVRRLAYSWNGNRDSFSYPVDSTGHPLPKDLLRGMFLNKESPLFPYFQSKKLGVGFNATKGKRIDLHRHKIKRSAEISSNLPSHYLIRQVSNSVIGKKGLYVPVIKLKEFPKLVFMQKTQMD